MTYRILFYLPLWLTSLQAASAQSLLQNIVRIEVTDTIGEEGNLHLGAGVVIGQKGSLVYIASVAHLFEHGTQKAKMMFASDAGKIPTRPMLNIQPMNDTDLAFFEVNVGGEQLRFNTLFLADRRSMRKNTEVTCIGQHPDGGRREDSSAKIDTLSASPGTLTLAGGSNVVKGYSGGLVFHPQRGQIIGMVIGKQEDKIECLKMSEVYRLADSISSLRNYLRAAPLIPPRLQALKYTGLGLLATAGVSRLISDGTYRTYQKSRPAVGANGNEEQTERKLDALYHKANIINHLAYITGGVGLLTLVGSVCLYKKLNPEKEFRIAHFFIRRVRITNDGLGFRSIIIF